MTIPMYYHIAHIQSQHHLLPVAVTTTTELTTALQQAQLKDSILQQVQQALLYKKPIRFYV